MILIWFTEAYSLKKWFPAKTLPASLTRVVVPLPQYPAIPATLECRPPQWVPRPAGATHDPAIMDSPEYAVGQTVDISELGDSAIAVGRLYFHPDARNGNAALTTPPTPFMARNPSAPVVLGEVPHLVLASFIINQRVDGAVVVGAHGDNTVVVRLYTFGCDNKRRRFDMASHFKDGEQEEGVEILDWRLVNFDSRFKPPGTALPEVYVTIYEELLRKLKETLG